MPLVEGGERQRDFRLMARQGAHAARVDPRGMAANIVFFDNERPDSHQSQMQSGGATMQPATDNYDIDRPGIHRLIRTTASIDASVWGSAASSPSVMGLIGKRSR